MRTILLISLILAACVDTTPVAAPAPIPNRAIAIVQLANKDAKCADLRKPLDVADSALCAMPGGSVVWLSVTSTALEIKQVMDAPKPEPAPTPAATPVVAPPPAPAPAPAATAPATPPTKASKKP